MELRKASTVCVLDDEPSALKAVCRPLISAGWKIEAFNDPSVFLRHAQGGAIAVAVVDMMMPRMNGLQVQAELRRLSPRTRVILLSSADDPAAQVRAISAGAVAYFSKPV